MGIGAHLRAYRIAEGLSQADVAKICGVSRWLVGRWERGVASPSVDQLALLCPDVTRIITYPLSDRLRLPRS